MRRYPTLSLRKRRGGDLMDPLDRAMMLCKELGGKWGRAQPYSYGFVYYCELPNEGVILRNAGRIIKAVAEARKYAEKYAGKYDKVVFGHIPEEEGWGIWPRGIILGEGGLIIEGVGDEVLVMRDTVGTPREAKNKKEYKKVKGIFLTYKRVVPWIGRVEPPNVYGEGDFETKEEDGRMRFRGRGRAWTKMDLEMAGKLDDKLAKDVLEEVVKLSDAMKEGAEKRLKED